MTVKPLAGIRVLELAAHPRRPLGRPDAGRSRRRRDQGRAAGRGRRHARLGAALRRRTRTARHLRPPISTPAIAASARSRSISRRRKARSSSARLAAARRRRDRELQGRRAGEIRARLREPARGQPAARSTARSPASARTGPYARARRLRLHDPGHGRDHGSHRRARTASRRRSGVAYRRHLHRRLRRRSASWRRLRQRDATGRGQHIDMALLDAQVAVLANQAMNYLVSRQDADADGQRASQHRALPGLSRSPTDISSSPPAMTGSSGGSAACSACQALAEHPAYAQQCASDREPGGTDRPAGRTHDAVQTRRPAGRAGKASAFPPGPSILSRTYSRTRRSRAREHAGGPAGPQRGWRIRAYGTIAADAGWRGDGRRKCPATAGRAYGRGTGGPGLDRAKPLNRSAEHLEKAGRAPKRLPNPDGRCHDRTPHPHRRPAHRRLASRRRGSSTCSACPARAISRCWTRSTTRRSHVTSAGRRAAPR